MPTLNIFKTFSKANAAAQPEITSEAYFNRLRKKEFSRLDKREQVYLDYTGANLYPASLVRQHNRFLQKAILGNPHSSNPASHVSEKRIGEARDAVLKFFNASDYYCVFTPNASGALKLIGECYPFSTHSHLLLTADNHNSVNGIRDYCRSKGAGYTYAPMNADDLSINETELRKQLHAHPEKNDKLFAYPAQSNASGVRHSLAWIKMAQAQGWDVLLDAAAFVPTASLDLSVVQPDFVSLSFYKMFGYPTGVGCLLVKKSTFGKLKKPWYAGGTITISSATYSGYFLKTDHEKFEDGTVNYLHIPAVTAGLRFIETTGMEAVANRMQQLGTLFLQQVLQLRHHNGLPLIKLYGPRHMEARGSTFLLNFFDARGQLYPFQFIEDCANTEQISLRTGCFCNPGIDELNHRLPAEDLRRYFTSRSHGDYNDMIRFLGKLRGAVRVSLGLPTNSADISRFVALAKQFLNKTVPEQAFTALGLGRVAHTFATATATVDVSVD